MWPLAWSSLPISLFSQPLPQRHQPDPALGIRPLERLHTVDAVIKAATAHRFAIPKEASIGPHIL
jgi:hypothetical protein